MASYPISRLTCEDKSKYWCRPLTSLPRESRAPATSSPTDAAKSIHGRRRELVYDGLLIGAPGRIRTSDLRIRSTNQAHL